MTQARRAPRTADGELGRTRILIVDARFYEDIADALLEGARRALEAAGVSFDRVTVPGCLELPTAMAIAVAAAERQHRAYDGVVALGCVIRGETLHFEIVAVQSARALVDYAVTHQLPLGNGILTVDTEAQAWSRARISEGDKGGDAARAALALIKLKRHVSAQG